MQARVTQNGEILLPEQFRARLNIKPGDSVDLQVEESRIVVIPHPDEHPKFTARIITDPISGLPVINIEGENVPTLTSADVERMLVDFP